MACYSELARWVCHARPRPQRGTSPSPREVFDRTTFPHPHPLWIPAFAGMTIRKISGTPKHFRNRATSSRIGVRDMLSCQSLMPVVAGTPRYEKLELWVGTSDWHGGFCQARPRPSGGQAPRLAKSSTALHFPHSPPLLDSGGEPSIGMTS